MHKKFLYVLIPFVFSLLLSACTDYDDNVLINLDSNWEFSVDSKDDFKPVEPKEFRHLNKFAEHRRGYVYLRTRFDVPENYFEHKLGVYFGIVSLAGEFKCNGFYIGSTGYFPPEASFENQQASAFAIPTYLLKSRDNTLEIKMWVDGYGMISTIPFITTEKNIKNLTKKDNLINSKIFLISSFLMFLVCMIYLFFYYLRPKDKSNLSFALLCFFSSLFLVNVCIGEYPQIFTSIKYKLIFEKIFNGYVPIITVYYAISFMRDFLGWKESRGRIIYRQIITLLPIIFITIPSNINIFRYCQFTEYAFAVIHLLYAVHMIIKEIINKNKKVPIMLLGFTPVLLSLLIELIIIICNIYMTYVVVILGWQLTIYFFLGVLIYSFAQMSKRIEFFNNNLERIVEERTTELTNTNKLLEETNYNLEFEKKRAEKEIELASFVQQNFYIHDLPDFSSYEVAFYSKALAGVSGDLYDFYSTADNLDGLGIFDVSGHGIASGLVTMLVKNIIQQEFYLGYDQELSEVMSLINDRVIYEKGNIENYLTGILIRIKEAYLELVNAGHPQPLFHSKADEQLYYYENSNQNRYGVIGISNFPIKFDTVSIDFKHGDELLLFTDGILESENKDGEPFGKENLMKAFKENMNPDINKQIQGIVNTLMDFMGETQLKDDITLVMLRKK